MIWVNVNCKTAGDITLQLVRAQVQAYSDLVNQEQSKVHAGNRSASGTGCPAQQRCDHYLDVLDTAVEEFDDETATGSLHVLHEDDISPPGAAGLARPICLCEGGGGMGLGPESPNVSTPSHLNLWCPFIPYCGHRSRTC